MRTRLNKMSNPGCERINTSVTPNTVFSGISSTGNAPGLRNRASTDWKKSGTYSIEMDVTGDVDNRHSSWWVPSPSGAASYACAPGEVWTVSLEQNMEIKPAGDSLALVRFFDASNALLSDRAFVPPTLGEGRYSATFEVPTGAVGLAFRYAHSNIDTGESFKVSGDEFLVEPDATEPGEFFYPDGVLSGWHGLADQSESSEGWAANGVARTYAGAAQRADQAAAHTLLGGDAVTNGTWIRLSSGSGDVVLAVNGESRTFTGAWPDDGEPHLWALVFDEPGDTAALYIDGELFEAKTGVTAQHSTRQGFVLGARGAGSDSFHGLIGPVAVLPRALTDDEHAALYEAWRYRAFG